MLKSCAGAQRGLTAPAVSAWSTQAFEARLVASAHDISGGGLAVTLAECSFGTDGLAAQVEFRDDEPGEVALFGERGARAIVTVDAARLARLSAVAAQYGVRAQALGRVVRGDFRIAYNDREIVRAPVARLEDLWTHSLERALAVSLPVAG